MNGQAFSAGAGLFQAAQPTLCTVNAEIGKVSPKERGSEADRDSFDAES